MKELGEYLRDHRLSNGVGVEEAASDLNISKDDIENIESGNIRAFKDVLLLKKEVGDYAKYLGLDPDKVIDEFNDFLFEHTSKISLEDILEAKKKIEDDEKEKIHSPYTIERKKKFNIDSIIKLKPLFISLLVILLLLLILFVYMKVRKDDSNNRTIELMGSRSDIYEFTK